MAPVYVLKINGRTFEFLQQDNLLEAVRYLTNPEDVQLFLAAYIPAQKEKLPTTFMMSEVIKLLVSQLDAYSGLDGSGNRLTPSCFHPAMGIKGWKQQIAVYQANNNLGW